jgi:hypothetical protein
MAEGTLDHIIGDMRAPEGGFYSALDADSEGEEGTFYVWTPSQVRALLADDVADLFTRCYDVSEEGNFEGSNILHLAHDLDAVAQREGMDVEQLRELLQEARQTLLEARKLREPPFRDEKVLASWNGMTIRTLAEVGGALGLARFRDAATVGLDFLLGAMRQDDRLRRVYKDGKARVDAFLEDYAAVGNAILSVYETTLDPRWLDEAVWIGERVVDLFWDDAESIFHDAPKDGEALTVRARDLMDNATPSGNSLAVEFLLRSSHLFGDERHHDIARRVLDREAGHMARFPAAFGRLLGALDRTIADPVEIAIVGNRDDPLTLELLQTALSPYMRNRTIAGSAPDERLAHDLPVLQGRDGGKQPVAYVCERYACKTPVSDPIALADQLERR